MRKPENINALAPEKYRSKKSKAADIQALNTHLFYGIIILKRVPYTWTFTDIISNYNRLVHIIASLIIQRENIPKEPICPFTTLKTWNNP